jgi:hypothetical protein
MMARIRATRILGVNSRQVDSALTLMGCKPLNEEEYIFICEVVHLTAPSTRGKTSTRTSHNALENSSYSCVVLPFCRT